MMAGARPMALARGPIEERVLNHTADKTPEGAREPTRVDPRLLEILVCPLTKSTLEYDSARQELISRSARLAFPIRDGIPIMLPEEARRIE
jgi:uncharacterized protein